MAELSDGLFDPTVGPLMKVWKMNTENAQHPARPPTWRARAAW